jgi:hypothetical protein
MYTRSTQNNQQSILRVSFAKHSTRIVAHPRRLSCRGRVHHTLN